jgi:hypothetical protein
MRDDLGNNRPQDNVKPRALNASIGQLRIPFVYLLALPVMWFLIDATSGATYGVLLGMQLRNNTALQADLVAFYRDRGLDERVVKQETLSIADKVLFIGRLCMG